jgi:hypothetical protein
LHHFLWGYWFRLVIEKVLSILPFSPLELYKKRSDHLDKTISSSFVIERLTRKIELFEKLKFQSSFTHLFEQGTGWHGIDLIVFFLFDLTVISRDTRELLHFPTLRRSIKILSKSRAFFHKKYHSLIDTISRMIEHSDLKLLDLLNVNYISSRSLSVPVNSNLQLFYSDSVLQRFTTKDLSLFLDSISNCPSEKVLHWHRIDCCDFHSIDRKEFVPELFYLTISKPMWNLLTSKYANYQNRLRSFQFVDLFRSFGFECFQVDATVRTSTVSYVKANLCKMSKDLFTMKIEDIAISKFTLVSSALK